MKYLVTGSAGFIGMHLCQKLLQQGENVVGIDSLNSYYDPKLKKARLAELTRFPHFDFLELDLSCRTSIESLFKNHKFDIVLHMAAQAGVRYSIENPHSYVQSNLVGFVNLLNACANANVEHFVYASSSSVYGLNSMLPFSEKHSVDHPISLYAATKRSNELLAHSYSHIHKIPTTGLRFFTVYGPWGRPDMALFLFTRSILTRQPIDIFNNGLMKRDFTYIDDVVDAVVRIARKPATASMRFDMDSRQPSISSAPFRLFNIGNNNPVWLTDYITELELALGSTAQKRYLPAQPGDIIETVADTDLVCEWIDYRPQVSIKQGVSNFVKWFREYYPEL
jgi:UDP-glucuronate 4-epimerase